MQTTQLIRCRESQARLFWRARVLLLSVLAFAANQAAANTEWTFKDANTSFSQLNGTWRYLPVAERWQHRRQQNPPVSHWTVDPNKGELVTFILPLKASEAEFGYLRNQLILFERYLDFQGVREILILMPADGIPKALSTLKEALKDLKRLQKLPMRLAPETLSVPDLLEGGTASSRFNSAKGWVRQQIVKMGAVELVETPFVLMLDADIFMLRDMSGLDLFHTSECTAASAVCDISGQTEYRALVDLLPINFGDTDSLRWWGNSAMVLQLNVTFADWKSALGITPQVVSTDLFKELGYYIQKRFDVPSWRAYLLDVSLPPSCYHCKVKGKRDGGRCLEEEGGGGEGGKSGWSAVPELFPFGLCMLLSESLSARSKPRSLHGC